MSDEKPTPSVSDPRQQLQEKILADSPRLGPNDTFKFSCQPGVSCFNKCCGDVNIFLSPYDVLRLKKRMGVESGEFLDKYTLLPLHKDMKTPIVVLKMNDDEAKSCPFLTENGCGVYTDRPWPCRMYPVGLAAQRDTPDGWRGERFYFLLKEDGCMGFDENPKEWTVSQWMDAQGVDEYDEWGEAYKELSLHKSLDDQEEGLAPQKMHMLFTSCYDLDKFREFIFESTLLERFEVDEDFVEEIRVDDEALLRFAFLWVRFSIFGEKTVRVKREAAEAFKGSLDKKEV